MKKSYYFVILMLLIGSSMILNASSQDQVSQTVYVHEGDPNGTLLSDVQVTGHDAAGSRFYGITDSNGVAVLSGQPGTWQFVFIKEGYNPLNLSYDVTETGEGAVYLQRANPTQEQVSQTQEQVSQTVYVHEGNLNGTLLSGVQVTGQDAAGSSFEETTDSSGVAVVSGQPGTWQFVFTKEGYDPLALSYNVTETGEGAVYLQRTNPTQELAETSPSINNS